MLSILTYWETVGKGSLMPHGLGPPLHPLREGLRPGTLPYQEVKSSGSQCWAYHLLWAYPSLFTFLSILPSLLKVCAPYGTWTGQGSICSLQGRARFVHCSKGGVLRGQLPRVSRQERPASHGGRMSTLEAALALSLLQVSAALVYAMFGWCVFTGNSDAKTLWTEVFRVLEVGLVTGALCPPLWGLVKRIGGLRVALRAAFLFL